jgi:hypothetical protein
VYLLYAPNREKLKGKELALTLSFLENLGFPKGEKGERKRLIYAPIRFANSEALTKYNAEYAQLPYEIYRKIEQ